MINVRAIYLGNEAEAYILDDFIAVSYTHLDVYKRQVNDRDLGIFVLSIFEIGENTCSQVLYCNAVFIPFPRCVKRDLR